VAGWAKAATPNIEEVRVFAATVATIPVSALPAAFESWRNSIKRKRKTQAQVVRVVL